MSRLVDSSIQFFRRVFKGDISFTPSNFVVFFNRSIKADLKPVRYAPHSANIYKRILADLGKEDRRFSLIKDYIHESSTNTILLRHDLDTPECLLNLPKLILAEQQFNLRSTIYVLADDHAYKISEQDIQYLHNLNSDGFEIGLHTRAYFQPDPDNYFHKEVKAFRDMFGFMPETVTLHGEYPRPVSDFEARRTAFIRNFNRIKSDLAIHLFHQITYPYQVLSDAWFILDDSGSRIRVLHQKFLKPMRHTYEGRLPVVYNTHPIYWPLTESHFNPN